MSSEKFQKSFASEQPVRLYKFIAISFLLLTVVLLVVIIFMSSKRATITIISKTEVVDVSGTVEVGKGSNAVTGTVSTTVITLNKVFSPTGDKEEPAIARGTVTLFNETSSAQPLIATTRLLSSEGVLFHIKDKVTVPAKGNITAEVYSDTMGVENNIGPTKFTVPGLATDKQAVIFAESEEAMTGGVATSGVISADDIKQAEVVLTGELEELGKKSFGEINPNMGVNFSIIQNTFESDKAIGEEVSEFTITGRATILAVMYDKKEVDSRARNLLLRRAVNDAETIEQGDVEPVVSLESYDVARGSAVLSVFYSGIAKLNADSKQLQKVMFFDKNKEEVRQYVLALDHVNSVDVEFKPAWIQTVPPVDSHVKIVIKQVE
ncbi:MAG: hypothetical protein CO137_00245 [Candidatus Magasanikbacteria bacterium CG_4_9_14_3_um_filter_32_9]|uniref:Baseplate protein J-like domain-containing protein n=1 Tax=Candidatus Magasanikbacteria bacterium CG_4_9_14_3_um_filter_32_9 TaxID=1974644 RepID=A0A2M7Z7R4_9BACT|nr:MAG: hypothetical protein CO137_00245 [Candidatus Magasanikbacteria bacterium CG_4_9_14_3_um_filter_32_9]